MNTGLHSSLSTNSPCTSRYTRMALLTDVKDAAETEQIHDWETYSDYDKKIVNVKIG